MAVSLVTNEDNMEFMSRYPDGFFDLAIVDPPYGIGEDGRKNHTRGKLAKAKNYQKNTRYDNVSPDKEYFTELFRVSKNQIIWGANHFGNMPSGSNWIVWDKVNGANDFADCELAFTSIDGAARIFKFIWNGMLQQNMKDKEIRIHPNHKPIALYQWTLNNYAKPGNKILDTHLGSGSSRIAAYDLGFDFYGTELDKDYYEAAEQRFKNHISQTKLFTHQQINATQIELL